MNAARSTGPPRTAVPLQNRATPFGDIVSDPARGAWMGNRGCLHDDRRRLTRRRWTTTAWIVCRLSFKGRQRRLMAPGRYTELFFLDEATAFAAGHRPCFECRRADALAFRAAWGTAFPGGGPAAGDMDRALHPERKCPPAERPSVADAAALPDGAFLFRSDEPDAALLAARGALWRWTPAGYREPRDARGRSGILLTPPGTVAVLAAGYPVQIDPSANRRQIVR